MKWFKEHKKVATIGLAGIFLLVLVLIGCGVAFSVQEMDQIRRNRKHL